MLFPLKKKSYSFINNIIDKRYHAHETEKLIDIIKYRLFNFELNLNELSINDALSNYHQIDKEILKKALEENIKSLKKLFTYKNIYKNTEYLKHYFSLESLAIQTTKCFYQELSTCIIHHVSYHDNSFKNIELYSKHYYSKKTRNTLLLELYTLAIYNIKFDSRAYYDREKLIVNIYNQIDNGLNSNLSKTNKHKRNIAIDCHKQLLKINHTEKNGIAYQTYYPFYDISKKNFNRFLGNQNCIFLLKTNEVNQLVKLLIRLFSKENKELKEDYNNDLRKFFSNDYDYPIKNTIKKNKKYFVYVIYLLHSNNKCNIDLLRKSLFERTGIKVKVFNLYFKDFSIGLKPKRHKLMNSFLNTRLRKNT
jgi:hypothetical protein